MLRDTSEYDGRGFEDRWGQRAPSSSIPCLLRTWSDLHNRFESTGARAARGGMRYLARRALFARWRLFWRPALTPRTGRRTKPAIYLDGVALCGLLKHPAPAHAPKPAPVATSSAAAPSAPPPRYHASQTPGTFADDDAIVDCDNDQFSVRPCSGTERSGCSRLKACAGRRCACVLVITRIHTADAIPASIIGDALANYASVRVGQGNLSAGDRTIGPDHFASYV